jgi:hypothetical protein
MYEYGATRGAQNTFVQTLETCHGRRARHAIILSAARFASAEHDKRSMASGRHDLVLSHLPYATVV